MTSRHDLAAAVALLRAAHPRDRRHAVRLAAAVLAGRAHLEDPDDGGAP